MFRSIFVFPDTDINDLIPVDELVVEKDSTGRPKNAQPVDQFDAQPFMMAENGFRSNDVSLLMKAESEDLKMQIASRMQEIKNSGIDLSDYTDEEIAKMTIPRYVNSAAQFRDWAASLEKSGFAKQVDAYIEANKAKFEQSVNKIDFSGTDEPKSE